MFTRREIWWNNFCFNFSVLERTHVPQRDTEVPDRNCGCECQPVRGAVCYPLHTDHVSAQTGGLTAKLHWRDRLSKTLSWTLTWTVSVQMLPLNTNIRLAYANGKDDEQNFIQNLSLFLCTFLKEHGQLIEKRLNLRETLMEVREAHYSVQMVSKLLHRLHRRKWSFIHAQMKWHAHVHSVTVPSVLLQALHYMLLVSEVEETEIFKICLEYWNHLAAELYRESPFSTSTSPLLSGNQHFDVPPRRQLYLPVLSKVLHHFY